MYTLLISILISFACMLLPGLLFDWSVKWTALPALAVGIAAFVWMTRRISKRFERINAAAEKELQALQQLGQQMAQRPTMRNPTLLAQRLDAAVAVYQGGFALEKWQIGIGTMLNARVGMLLFSKPSLVPDASIGDCIPYLEKAQVKGKKAQLLSNLWPAWAMLGIAYYKKDKKDLGRARAVFEAALANVRKEGLFWQIYAWILAQEEQIDDAIGVLARARQVLPDDEPIKENLTALQNRKKMQMRAYGELWYQFALETPKIAMAPRMPHPRARGGAARRR
jgi:tetratricopeptide (TPR) repeat protein